MNRRTFLAVIGGGIGGAYLVSQSDRELPTLPVNGTQLPVGSGYEEGWPKTESLGGPFKEIRYFEDGTAEIVFNKFHEIDGWFLMYHRYDDIDNALHVCEAPDRSSPSVSINLIELLQAQNTEYPDRRFNLIAARGSFDGCSYQDRFNLITKRVHTATIHIPPEFTIATTPTAIKTPTTPTPTPDDGNTTVGYE